MTVRSLIQFLAATPAPLREAALREALPHVVKGMTDDDLTALVVVGLALTALYVTVAPPVNDPGVDVAQAEQAALDLFVSGVRGWAAQEPGDPVPLPPAPPAPLPPAPDPTVPSAPAPPSSGANDAIDIGAAALTPGQVRDWPIATKITRLALTDAGVVIEFDALDRWPDIVPPGWEGPIVFTIWIGKQLGDGWHVAASLDDWYRDATPFGGPVTNPGQYGANLWYLDGALKGVNPGEGESIVFMVTSGAQRGVSGADSVQERSQLVAVPFTSAGGSWNF